MGRPQHGALTLFHHDKHRRHCSCGKRALYYSHARRRHVHRPDHPLCQRCARAELDRLKARNV